MAVFALGHRQGFHIGAIWWRAANSNHLRKLAGREVGLPSIWRRPESRAKAWMGIGVGHTRPADAGGQGRQALIPVPIEREWLLVLMITS